MAKGKGKGKGKAPGDKKRKGRRARGTGSIFYSDAAGKWIGRKTVGKTAKGKPKRVEVWADTQAEVVKKLAAALPPGPNTTVEEYAVRWLAGLDVRPATISGYSVCVNTHIVPALGGVKVSALTTGRVETFGAELVKGGMKGTSARGVLTVLGTMLRAAVREGLIAVSPVTDARRPRGGVKRLEPYSPPELARIIAHAAKGEYTPAPVVALLAGVGCRVGEALALDVGDFDQAAGTIHIHQTYDYSHGLGPTKSPHSVRTIRVPAPVLPVLVIAAGSRTTGPLFQTSKKTRFILGQVRATWFRICREIGLEERKPHQLRHSVATALIAAQVPLGDVAKFLGDRVETIVKTYLHPTGVDPTITLDRLLGG